jgi:hypothetical protein
MFAYVVLVISPESHHDPALLQPGLTNLGAIARPAGFVQVSLMWYNCIFPYEGQSSIASAALW